MCAGEMPTMRKSTLSLLRTATALLLLSSFTVLAGANKDSWWKSPSAFVSSPARWADDLKSINADAGRGAYHAGWYGLWHNDTELSALYRDKTFGLLEKEGLKKLVYFDAGELGDYLVWVSPNRRMLYNGWSLFQHKGEKGKLYWFGLEGFMRNAEWITLKTARDYGIKPFTYPDGRAASTDNWYDAIGRKDVFGKLQVQFFSEKRITDELASRLKLTNITRRQEGKADVQGKTGWIHVRQYRTDWANRQYLEYHKKELSEVIRRYDLDGIHFDNFAGNNTLFIKNAGFGEWSMHYFRHFMQKNFKPDALKAMGIDDIRSFDIRKWFLTRPWRSKTKKPIPYYWFRQEWRNEKIFRCYQLALIESALHHHGELYKTVKASSQEKGRDLPVIGNVIPLFPGAALFKGLVDIPCFEWATYKTYTLYKKPMGTPPEGRIGWASRVAAKLGNAGYAVPSTYVRKNMQGPNFTEMHKVMQFDCLANRAVYDFGHWFLDGYSPGTPESAGFGNAFLKAARKDLTGRQYIADIALVWSAWSQMAAGVPGGHGIPQVQKMYMEEYVGWGDYLAHSHHQWDVLLEQDLVPDAMRRFKVIILPSCISLSGTQIKNLQQFADAGGKIIMTGETGAYFGPKGFLMPRRNKAVLRKLANHKHCISVSDRPGAAYREEGKEVQSKASIEDLLSRCAFRPALTTVAPAHAGISLNCQQNGARAIDIVNYNVNIEENRITPLPKFSLTLSSDVFRRRPSSVWIRNAGENGNKPRALDRSAWKVRNDAVVITVPAVTYYAMIIIE
jgi:hypothetical protein